MKGDKILDDINLMAKQGEIDSNEEQMESSDEISEIDKVVLVYDKSMMLMGDWEIIYKFSESRKVKVELGTADGLTSILISRSGGVTYTIDKNNDSFIKDFLNRRFGIVAIQGDTANTSALFADESIGFLFIDGSHKYEDVKKDYFSWLPKVAVNAVILFHDVDEVHCGVWQFYNSDIQEEVKKGHIRELIQKPNCKAITKVFVKEISV